MKCTPWNSLRKVFLYHVVKEAGGVNSKIVVIPTASSIPKEVGESYLEAFATLGCENVTVLDIRSKEDSEKQTSIDLIKSAGLHYVFWWQSIKNHR